ncbi:hypothetical protein PULV_a2310 [Pseudoalteromonas ulvae UL12]|uniref:sensor histidine kinase n=1 Tax=Pseudoalteromonas ulvae TaxID=107327 RepID=UPI00186B8A7A|nr:ATP-binding protein [Pseudoalteromonas ulvae]MBE0364587.1 hypothetical protein [Pseudoalteromonas ulvae UL12]
MQSHWVLAGNLGALIGLNLLACYLLLQHGLSASLFLLGLINIGLIGHIFSLFKRQQRQAEMVIRALANGDSTLGLGHQHPMRQQFEQVKDQMQTARFNAEQQAQFLHALLIHIDLAVLVCDDDGEVIESNPAVFKLLGQSINHLNKLGAIGELLLASDTNLRTTSQWQSGEQLDTLSIQLSIATIQGKNRRVISIQSIHDQLQHKEQQAYKRLTKVLTHEVANSITPLASLAHTCTTLLPESLQFNDQEDKQDLQLALNTIASRTQHLGEFIARFRQISRLPAPNLHPTDLAPMLERVIALHQQQASKHGITLTQQTETQQLVMLDASQVEQVLINLVKNALEVLIQQQQTKQPSELAPEAAIRLTLGQNTAQQYYLEVADTGPGIAEHVVEMIFVPFFTTKQHGSGIGLSLSRQIMLNHGGDLIYLAKEQGACFRCVFG